MVFKKSGLDLEKVVLLLVLT